MWYYFRILFSVPFTLIVGCATFSNARLSNVATIREGQSKDDVIKKIGKPSERIVRAKGDLWYYDIYSEDSAKIYPYTAIFEGETLKSFFADQARGADARSLCVKRQKSDQTIFQFAGQNGAPAIPAESCGD